MRNETVKSRSGVAVDRYKNPDADPRGPYVRCDLTALGSIPTLHFEWRGRTPREGRVWRFNRENLDNFEAEGRIVWLSRGGMPTLKRYLSEVSQQREEPAPSSDPGRVEFILRTTMRTLAKSIAHFPDELRILEWRDLERVLREVFEGLGFKTRLTPPAQDGGFDLELSCVMDGKPETFLVEVKHWTFPSRPGRGILEKFFDVVVTRPAVAGLLLSTSGFTTSVVTGRTEIERQRIRLGDGNKIVTLCQYYVRRDSGLWEATLPLPELLFDGTL